MFIESDWELFYFTVWSNSRLPRMEGVYIDPVVVFRYADEYGLRGTETLEIIQEIQRDAENGQAT